MKLTRESFISGRDVVFANVLRSNVCGHLFECIEYYYFFMSTYDSQLGRTLNPCIYLAYDNFSKNDLKNVLENKYSFTDVEIKKILDKQCYLC